MPLPRPAAASASARPRAPQTLTIGKLAEQAGVGIDTIRYYERAGLLPSPPRRASGYRDYPLDTLSRLRFIRRAKDLGFALEEIGELLALSGSGDGVPAIRAAARAKLELVEHKLTELERVRDALKTLIRACPGHGPTTACPILRALSDERPEKTS